MLSSPDTTPWRRGNNLYTTMNIGSIRTIPGPNVHSHRPVLVAKLSLEELAGKKNHDIEGFNERLLAALPGVRGHYGTRGKLGDFMEQLDEGMHFGRIVERVTLELSDRAGIPVTFGKTRRAGEPGEYDLVVAYKAEQGMRHLLGIAVDLVDALVKGEEFPLDERMREARRIIANTELGPSTQAIIDAAERANIPWRRIGDRSLVQLGYGKHRKFIQAAMTGNTSSIAIDIAGDKQMTKQFLEDASIPVPRGVVVRTEEDAVAAQREIGGPVVIKPLDGRQGKGVSLNLIAPEEIRAAFAIAREYSRHVIVEELVEGRNYRVLVVGGKMVAASERIPAHVVGDGEHSIAELIEIANQSSLRGDGHEKPLTKIIVTPIVAAHLQKWGRTLDDVPAADEMVHLQEGINLSTGGVARDVTDEVHPTVVEICERAARIIGMDICGVDLMLPDIAMPMAHGRGAVIEINAAPGLRMHQHPSEGEPRDAGAAIIDMLYPPDTPSRIPIISITGTNGKTTVTRLIGHAIAESGRTVGMTTTGGIYINEHPIVSGDTTGPASARTVLGDPAVEVAVLETARGGILRRGLGYDWSDISVITNIQPDHFGQDGINDIDDLVYIKSLVAERVREGGTLVLNADDERLAHLMDVPRVNRVKKNVVYFSMRRDNPVVREHLDRGRTVYLLKGGWVMEVCGRTERKVVEASAIPITLCGTAEFQVQNVMAAVAVCRAFGLTVDQTANAMMSFRNQRHNPGRTNLYRLPSGGYVMVDYGHNPEAFRMVTQMISRWSGRHVTGIIGAPGDRTDTIIEELGRVAAKGFDRLIIAEDYDLRGRRPGEVAGILCNAVMKEAPDRRCEIILDEAEALANAIDTAGPSDVVIVFYDRLDPLLAVLRERHAVTVDVIEGLDGHPAAHTPYEFQEAAAL